MTLTLQVPTLELSRRSSFCSSCMAGPGSLDNSERLGERSDPFPFPMVVLLLRTGYVDLQIKGVGTTCLSPPQTCFTN